MEKVQKKVMSENGHKPIHEQNFGMNLAQFWVPKIIFREDAFLKQLPDFCLVLFIHLGHFNLTAEQHEFAADLLGFNDCELFYCLAAI